MTEKVRSAITSDKVKTDNQTYAIVKADQTCEDQLIPSKEPVRQLDWQVTMEKGSVYTPTNPVGGIYAEEVDLKYGVQVKGDVFGRNVVTVEHGGARHGSDGKSVLGARVFGSLIGEGQVEVVAPSSKMDDWETRPVEIFGDVMGSHVTFEEPTVVYGNVVAEQTFRTNAPTLVLGDVRSNGIVETSDLFAFSLTAQGDLTLGRNVVLVNPTVRSREGTVRIVEVVGIFTPELFEEIRQQSDVDVIGLWVFDLDAVWEGEALYPDDVIERGEGSVADRSWRTYEEYDTSVYERVRRLFREMVESTRKDPPDIEAFQYAGLGTLSDLGGTIEGDVVIGRQEKTVEETDVTNVDQSVTQIDDSTEIHDQSTTVEDSVVKGSDVSGGDDGEREDEDEEDDDFFEID